MEKVTVYSVKPAASTHYLGKRQFLNVKTGGIHLILCLKGLM
jgi:hypothetical protein